MKKLLVIGIMICVAMLFIQCHTHEPSEKMKEVIALNKSLWEDLNSTKSLVKKQINSAEALYLELDSAAKVQMEVTLTTLKAQKQKLKELDQHIPELKGYEPKCNHEPGEPHEHNTLDVSGIPDEELLELHKELKKQLNEVKSMIK